MSKSKPQQNKQIHFPSGRTTLSGADLLLRVPRVRFLRPDSPVYRSPAAPCPMVVWWRECQGLQWKAPGGNPLRDEGESRRRGGGRRRTATAVAAHSACVVAPPQCISPSTHAQARGFRAVGVDIECLGRIRVGEVIVAIAGFICR